jgi:hypothetical protein
MPSMTDKLRRLADEIFGVDLRGLGALRISLGGLTLVDLALRSPDFCSFCTDGGVFPRAIAKAMAPPGRVSLSVASRVWSPTRSAKAASAWIAKRKYAGDAAPERK